MSNAKSGKHIKQINYRVSPALFDEVAREAKRRQLSKSEFVRQLLIEATKAKSPA